MTIMFYSQSADDLRDLLDVLRPQAAPTAAPLDSVQMTAFTGDTLGALHLVPDAATTATAAADSLHWEQLAWALGYAAESCITPWDKLLELVRDGSNRLASAHLTSDRLSGQIDAIRKIIPGHADDTAEQLVQVVNDLVANHDNAVHQLRALITERDELRAYRDQLIAARSDDVAELGRVRDALGTGRANYPLTSISGAVASTVNDLQRAVADLHERHRASRAELEADRDRARTWAVELENQLRATDALVESLQPPAADSDGDPAPTALLNASNPPIGGREGHPVAAALATAELIDGPPANPPARVIEWGRGFKGAAAHLRQHPGVWICLQREYLSAGGPSRIKQGTLAEFAPAGHFDAATRSRALWARYIGPTDMEYSPDEIPADLEAGGEVVTGGPAVLGLVVADGLLRVVDEVVVPLGLVPPLDIPPIGIPAIPTIQLPGPAAGLCVACRHRPAKHTADGCTAGECDCLEFTD